MTYSSATAVTAGAAMLVLVAIDQSTKWAARATTWMPNSDPTANDTLALGIDGGLSTSLTLVVSTIAALVWSTAVWTSAGSERTRVVSVAVFVAGFLGNAIDRARLGYVQDWFVVGPMRWNFADVALAVGIAAGLFLLGSTVTGSRHPRASGRPA